MWDQFQEKTLICNLVLIKMKTYKTFKKKQLDMASFLILFLNEANRQRKRNSQE